jgi:ABC-type transport system substrate-binding protein
LAHEQPLGQIAGGASSSRSQLHTMAMRTQSVGVKVTLVGMEFNALMSNLTDDFQFDAILMGRAVRRPDPSFGAVFYRTMFRRYWATSEASAEPTRRADAFIDEMLYLPDQERRLRVWRELHQIVNDQGWVVWLPAQNLKAPARDRFANLRPSVVIGGATGIVWNSEEFFVKSQASRSN